MQKQETDQAHNVIFEQYVVKVRQTFRIVQNPFRNFSKYQRDGHWSEKQRLKYTVFLSFFKRLLQEPQKKKSVKIYEMMSDMIITRSPNQCRTHHKKMQLNRLNISQIIASVTQKYEPRVFKEIEEKYLNLIKTILQNSEKYIRIRNQNDKRQKFRPQNSNNQKQTEPILQSNQIIQIIEKSMIEQVEEMKSQQLQQKIANQQNIAAQINLQIDKSQISTVNVMINDSGRVYYQYQMKQIQLLKQWHIQNAKHLILQWNNQIESIRLCEQKIYFFKETFDEREKQY